METDKTGKMVDTEANKSARPGPKPRPLKERFWAKVDKRSSDQCWNWTGLRDRYGYGTIQVCGKKLRAHRVSWELANGPIPAGMCVLHRCDNPSCVNPRHLWIGRQEENIQDMASKGRRARGEKHGSVKLIEQDVHEIRQMLSWKILQRVIAKKYGVSRQTISMIKTGKNWGWLN